MTYVSLHNISMCFSSEDGEEIIRRLSYPKELVVEEDYRIAIIIPERSKDWRNPYDYDDDDSKAEEFFFEQMLEIYHLRRKVSDIYLDIAKEKGITYYTLEKTGAVFLLDPKSKDPAKKDVIILSELRRLCQWGGGEDSMSRAGAVERAMLMAAKTYGEEFQAQDLFWKSVCQDFLLNDFHMMGPNVQAKAQTQSPLYDGCTAIEGKYRSKILTLDSSLISINPP